MPSADERIRTLIAIGFPPEQAAAVVHQKFDEQPFIEFLMNGYADLAHAQRLLHFAGLVPERYQSLFDAQALA